jgi:hypothetical protein
MFPEATVCRINTVPFQVNGILVAPDHGLCELIAAMVAVPAQEMGGARAVLHRQADCLAHVESPAQSLKWQVGANPFPWKDQGLIWQDWMNLLKVLGDKFQFSASDNFYKAFINARIDGAKTGWTGLKWIPLIGTIIAVSSPGQRRETQPLLWVEPSQSVQ